MPTCIICLDVLKDPAALPCGHVFCHHCIIRIVRSITPYTHHHFCPTCRKPYTISQVDPTLVPHYLQPHVTPAVRRLHLEYSIPSGSSPSASSASSSPAAECDRLRAEVASLRAACVVWRKRAAMHAAATLGLVGLARITRDTALKAKAEKDTMEAKYQALKKSFEESQTISTFPPQPCQTLPHPTFCEALCETPAPVDAKMTRAPSRAASHASFHLPSPTPSEESYCSDCPECNSVSVEGGKRKREEVEVDEITIKRSRSSSLSSYLLQSPHSPSPRLAKEAIKEYLAGIQNEAV